MFRNCCLSFSRFFCAAAVAAVLACPLLAAETRSRLMTIGFDGRDARVVLASPAVLEAPNWSPDGKWLVFNLEGSLLRIPADGSAEPEVIHQAGALKANNDHVISPDGERIYFSAGGHIYRIPFDGGEPVRVSNEHPEESRLVYWLHGISPDGKTLLHCGDRVGNKDIWSIPAEGGEDRRLTSHPAEDDGPDFSPDGKWIWFNSDRSGSNQVWRMPVDGGEERAEQMTRDDRVNWFPHPSPDGQWVVYLSYPPGTLKHPRDRDVILKRMTADGKDPIELRALNGGQGTINVPSWSPDGKRFAFVEFTRPR